MGMTHLGFIEIPSQIPKREPVILVHNEQRITFNAIRYNGHGFDLLMEYEPISFVADGLTLSENAKCFLGMEV